jgi:biopolymer transport protein ExbD
MKIVSPLPRRRGRIEIIPLIDIMFFLLAAFMVVSINKIKVNSLKVSLPTDVPGTVREKKEDFINISINLDGQVAIENEVMTNKDQFVTRLAGLYAANHDQKILISTEKEGRIGDVILALGLIRQAGFQRVAFNIKKEVVAGLNPDGSLATPAANLPTPTPNVTPSGSRR